MYRDGVIKIITIICALLFLPYLSLADDNAAHKRSSNQEPLIFGILPFSSPVALLKRFSPLRDYLQQKLGRAIILETASNYDEFVLRTHSGRYDFVYTAPHFTLLALDSGKYDLKATYLKPLSAAISVPRDSNIRRLQQLSGKTISTPAERAIITMAGKNHIFKQQLKEPPIYLTHKSHNASINSMMFGKSSAAVASIYLTRQLVKNGNAIRIISVTPPLPGMGLLAANKLPDSLHKKFQQTLVSMIKDKHGYQILKSMGYPGYKTATQEEFEIARIFLKK